MNRQDIPRISGFALALLKKYPYGSVHSVFRSSINIELAGNLVHINVTTQPLCSFGMAVSEAVLTALLTNCRAGDIVVCGAEIITVYASSICTIPLGVCTAVDLSLPKSHPPAAEIKNSRLFDSLCKFPFEAECGLVKADRTAQFIALLAQNDTRHFDAAATYFLGRGKGLTPAGDDFLWGYSLARIWLGKESGWITVYDGLDWQRTTAVSHAYYRALRAGFINEDWLLLCKQGFDKDINRAAEAALAQILKTGHTSGVDTLFGFVTGIYSIILKEVK